MELDSLERAILDKAADAYPEWRTAIENAHIVERLSTVTGTRTVFQFVPYSTAESSPNPNADVVVTININPDIKAELQFVNRELRTLNTAQCSQLQTPGAQLQPPSLSDSEGQLSLEQLAALVVSMALNEDDKTTCVQPPKDRQQH